MVYFISEIATDIAYGHDGAPGQVGPWSMPTRAHGNVANGGRQGRARQAGRDAGPSTGTRSPIDRAELRPGESGGVPQQSRVASLSLPRRLLLPHAFS